MAKEFYIPKLGQTVEEVTLIEWLVEDGVRVEAGQPVLEVETDKAVFPVEANASGYLHIGPFQKGDVLPVLAVVGVIGREDDRFAAKSAPDQPERPVEPVASPSRPAASPISSGDGEAPVEKLFASPRARRLANEKNVDLSRVTPTGDLGRRVIEKDVMAYLSQLSRATPVAQKVAALAGFPLDGVAGTGPGGRVTRADVEKLLAPEEKPAPETPAWEVPAPLTEVPVLERIPLSGVRGIIAGRMGTSVHTTARVTLVTEVDATEFSAMRERLKTEVTEEWGFAPGYNDLLAKIVAAALRKFPYMNARLAPDAIELLSEVNMGMAVDTERGLLVPVIRNADRKSLRQFGLEFRQLVERARDRKSLPDDLTGGTFTITNLGAYDIDAFTPVINLPEAAILGVGRIAPRVVPLDRQVAIRTMCTLSLVFDHRLVDGAPAARFLQYIKKLMEEPYLLISALQE